MRTLIVTGMGREARAVGCGARTWRRDDPSVALGGADSDACVLIAGVCRGLDPSLAPGALILARAVAADGAPELVPAPGSFGAARRALRMRHPGFVSSKLLTVGEPLDGVRARTEAWNAHGAAGIDMETYDIARACEARGLAWVAVRAVLDPAGARLPRAAAAWREDSDDAAIARSALTTPRDWPAYLRLALQLRTSLQALSAAIPALVSALGRLDAHQDAFAAEVAVRAISNTQP